MTWHQALGSLCLLALLLTFAAVCIFGVCFCHAAACATGTVEWHWVVKIRHMLVYADRRPSAFQGAQVLTFADLNFTQCSINPFLSVHALGNVVYFDVSAYSARLSMVCIAGK